MRERSKVMLGLGGGLLLASACADDAPPPTFRAISQALVEDEALTLVYERVDRLSDRGEILETWERGELSRDVAERNARPHLHPGTRALRSRAFDLHEEGGTRLRGLQILESEDVVPAPPEPPPGVEVDPQLAAKLEVTDAARSGCSFATPFVAGAAAVAKDYFLAKGHGWINDPGQLHTVMLAMGDRTQEKGASPAQEPTTPDWDWGFGKLKMRLFEPLAPGMTPYGFDRLSVFLTTFSSHATLVLNGGATLPTGTSLVKCVSHQSEYMDNKDRVSDIDLELELYAPFGGSCAVVTPVTLRSDAGWDTSRFVAFESSETTLAGKCARVRLKKAGVTSSGIGVHAFCYYAGMDDDEPS